MNSSTFVVKKENEIDALLETYFNSSPVDSCEVKNEVPFQIKTEPTEASISSTNLINNAECGSSYALHAPQLVENFMIYELEAAASPTPSKTFKKPVLEAPTVKVIAAPFTTKQFQHQPPILLNTKFRKRPRVEIPSASPVSAIPPLTPTESKINNISAHDSFKIAQHPAIPVTTATELKVKCFCRLGNLGGSTPDASSTTNGHELKGFFERMFNETRQLSREQQRAIKMELLEAICEAEERTEEGKSCDKCCSSK